MFKSRRIKLSSIIDVPEALLSRRRSGQNLDKSPAPRYHKEESGTGEMRG